MFPASPANAPCLLQSFPHPASVLTQVASALPHTQSGWVHFAHKATACTTVCTQHYSVHKSGTAVQRYCRLMHVPRSTCQSRHRSQPVPSCSPSCRRPSCPAAASQPQRRYLRARSTRAQEHNVTTSFTFSVPQHSTTAPYAPARTPALLSPNRPHTPSPLSQQPSTSHQATPTTAPLV